MIEDNPVAAQIADTQVAEEQNAVSAAMSLETVEKTAETDPLVPATESQ